MKGEDLEQQVTDLLILAKERMKDGDYVASMVHCRKAMEVILHQIHFEVHEKKRKEYITNSKWINSFRDYLVEEKKPVLSLLYKVNNGTNRWLHSDPNVTEVAEEHHVNKVINNLRKIMKKLYSLDIDYEPIYSPLLKEFEKQLSEISREDSNLTDSARDFLESLPEGERKEGWKKYFELNPTAEIKSQYERMHSARAIEYFYAIIEEIHDVEFQFGLIPVEELEQMKERGEVDDNGSGRPFPLPFVFFKSGKSHLFVDEFLSICKEGNPNASFWDVTRESSPEELASKMHLFIDWLDMRLVPEGEGGEVVQLYPGLDRTPPEDIDFDKIRKQGTYSILREAFRFRGVDKMRPQQLMTSLANLGCDIEWILGSRKSSAEDQLKGIPDNCIKWLDSIVIKHPDGDEVLLSLKDEKDESEEK